uniref:Uncharacterized protein n=1 Tax=Heliothis virescens TaxID=7102 RepID=A0A2A4J2Q7_HELVI
MNIQNIEKALRRSDNTDKDPELLKRINDLEKELKDVKNRLSNVTNVVIVTVTEKAVTVTEKEKMKDNFITQVLYGPYAPEIKKDGVSPDVVTGIMDKKPQENELNTVTETVVGDFYTDNRTVHEEIPLENTTDFNTKIDDNFGISYPVSNADFYYTVPEYPAMRDVLMHSDEAGPWGDSYKFDMIKATKSTPMEVTTPKDNITNSTTTAKPTSLATPIKSSTTLHAARFVLEDAKNDVVSLLLNKKQIPISTLGPSPSILPTNQNISNDTTAETTTVATTNAVDNTTTFGATFYRTLEPINWEELSTPYGFYRRADGRYVPGYPDLENTFI